MRRREQPLGVMDNLLFPLLGGSYPETYASAPPRVEGLICIPTEGRILAPLVSFVYFPYATYPLGMHGVSRDINKINWWPVSG
jgi:hypothetical protein